METTRSVRAYFLFFGSIDLFIHYSSIREVHEATWLSLIGLVRGIVYICIGLTLRTLLNRSFWVVRSSLVAGLCYSFWFALTRASMGGLRDSPAEVSLRLISAVFLTFYVLDNIKRLAAVKQSDSE
jgi:hypothetical protein